MAKLRVLYDPKNKQSCYTIYFNPSRHAVEEASTFSDSFEACLDFIMKQFVERTDLTPKMQRFDLEAGDPLPRRQIDILQHIVGLYNRSAKLYETLADPKSFKNLAEYFNHQQ